jgi:hypothetical protein
MKEESAIFTNSFAALALDDGDEPDTTNKYSPLEDVASRLVRLVEARHTDEARRSPLHSARKRRCQLRRAFENVPSAVLGAIDAQEDWYTVGKRAWRIQVI